MSRLDRVTLTSFKIDSERAPEPVGLYPQGASSPEPHRGAQHHDEQAYSLDEHRLPRRRNGPRRTVGSENRELKRLLADRYG